MYLIYENLNGVGSNHKLFKTTESAENYFEKLISEKEPDMSVEDMADFFENGGFDNGNGYEIVVCWVDEAED